MGIGKQVAIFAIGINSTETPQFFTAIGALISSRFLPFPMSYSCIGGVSHVSHGGTFSLPVIAWD